MGQISGYEAHLNRAAAEAVCLGTGGKVVQGATSGPGGNKVTRWLCIPSDYTVEIVGGPGTGMHWATVITPPVTAAVPAPLPQLPVQPTAALPLTGPTVPLPPGRTLRPTPPATPTTPTVPTVPASAAPGAASTAGLLGSQLAAAIQDVQNNPQISPSFNEQCFLIEKAKAIYTYMHAGNQPSPVAPHTEIRVRQLGISPLTGTGNKTNLQYINKITELNKTKHFFEITPAETAQLAHYAAVFVANRRPGGYERLKPIFGLNESRRDLPTNLSMFQSTGLRTGAGIQSIDVTYEGIDSATKKIVLVNATYIFQDIRTMLETNPSDGVPYGELFRLATCENCATGDKTFRTIDFEIGWNSRNHSIGSEPEGLATRLNLDGLVLKLRTNLVKYTFDLKQDGAVVVTAQYRGHIVDVLGGPSSNILAYSKGVYTLIRNNLEAIENTAAGLAAQSALSEKQIAYSAIARTLVKRALETGAHGTLPSRGTGPLVNAGYGRIGNFIDPLRTFVEDRRRAMVSAAGDSWSDDDQGLLQHEITYQLSEIRKHLMQIPHTEGSNEWRDAEADIIERHKSLALIEQATAASGQTRTAQDLAQTLALSQQIKEAKMAKFAALQEIGKKMIATDDLHYAFVLRRPTIENFQILASGRDPSGAPTGNSNTQQLKALINSLSPAQFVTTRSLTERELDNDVYQVIPFVFLGKLIENILALPTTPTVPLAAGQPAVAPSKTIYQSMLEFTGRTFNVDFGHVTYKQPYTGDLNENFKLYYLPISLTKINNFFAREVVAKEREFFAFNDFLLAVLQKFLTNLFSVCVKEANSPAFISPKIQTVVGNAREPGIGRNLQYFVYGFKNVEQDIRQGNISFGNYIANWRNHIYHFYLGGQIKGAVKNVKVTDIADETTKTAIYYQQRASARAAGDPNNIAQYGGFPPVVFQAEVETIGFPMFNMGQLIYIDLQPYISDKDSRQFKANGYYGITKVSHTFTAETFSSKVNAILQYSKWDKENSSASSSTSSTGTAIPPPAGPISPRLIATRVESDRIKNQTDWLLEAAGGESATASEVPADSAFPGQATPGEIEYLEKTAAAKEAYLQWFYTGGNDQYLDPECKFKASSNANRAHYMFLLQMGIWNEDGTNVDKCT